MSDMVTLEQPDHRGQVVCDAGDVVEIGKWLRDTEWCSIAVATDDGDVLTWMSLGAVKRLRDILNQRIEEAESGITRDAKGRVSGYVRADGSETSIPEEERA